MCVVIFLCVSSGFICILDLVLNHITPDLSNTSNTTRVQVVNGSDGRLVVMKIATGISAAQRLMGEAAALRTARHPGVVELIGVETCNAQTEMMVAWAGSRTLSEVSTLEPEEVAGLIAAVATTVAHLHGIGITHGRISRDHVIIGREGTPVLCGFASAGQVLPADDVCAIGHLMSELLDLTPTTTRPARGLKRTHTSQSRARLGRIATTASDPEPTRRPTAQALADATLAAVTTARLLDAKSVDTTTIDLEHAGSGGATKLPNPINDLRPSGVATYGHSRHHELSAEDREDDDIDAVLTELTSIVRTTRAHRRRTPSLLTMMTTGTVGLLCVAWLITGPLLRAARPSTATAKAPAITPIDTEFSNSPAAPVLEHDGTRFQLGIPGDIALVADWRCSGNPVPAVIRPSSREMFVFDAWASASTPVAASPLIVLPEEVDITSATADPSRCGTLIASRLDGQGVAIAITNPAPEIGASKEFGQ